MKDRSLAATIIASTPSRVRRVRRSFLNESSFEFISLDLFFKVRSYFTNCGEKDYRMDCEIFMVHSEPQPLKAN